MGHAQLLQSHHLAAVRQDRGNSCVISMNRVRYPVCYVVSEMAPMKLAGNGYNSKHNTGNVNVHPSDELQYDS